MNYKGKWIVDYFVKQFPTFIKYKLGISNKPIDLMLVITQNCNSKCIMCDYWKNNEKNERFYFSWLYGTVHALWGFPEPWWKLQHGYTIGVGFCKKHWDVGLIYRIKEQGYTIKYDKVNFSLAVGYIIK